LENGYDEVTLKCATSTPKTEAQHKTEAQLKYLDEQNELLESWINEFTPGAQLSTPETANPKR